jgi:hypothetical protein
MESLSAPENPGNAEKLGWVFRRALLFSGWGSKTATSNQVQQAGLVRKCTLFLLLAVALVACFILAFAFRLSVGSSGSFKFCTHGFLTRLQSKGGSPPGFLAQLLYY